jgi:hypothetical protein
MNKLILAIWVAVSVLAGCTQGVPAPSQVTGTSLLPADTIPPYPSKTTTRLPQRTIQPPSEMPPTLVNLELIAGYQHTQIAALTATSSARMAYQEATARAKVAQAVMTATPPVVSDTHLSADGQWRVEVVHHDCVEVGEVEQNAYELLRLVHIADGMETTIADQLVYCGGLGAYGLGFVYWSADSRYLYYTDSGRGVPDGWSLGWYPTLFLYDLTTKETTSLRWGPIAPDGVTMAYVDPRESSLYIWNLEHGEVARIPSPYQPGSYGPAIYGMAWSLDGKKLVYVESENAYDWEPANAKSSIMLLDLATFERQVIYQSEKGNLYCCQYLEPGRIQFQINDQEFQYIDVPQGVPEVQNPNSLWCERPVDLAETKVAVSNLPGAPQSMCIVWPASDKAEDGYRVELKYEGSGEVFEYTAGLYGTQWIVPLEEQPRLDESQEQYLNRHSYSISIFAVNPKGETLIGETAVEVDHPDFLSLPTATLLP